MNHITNRPLVLSLLLATVLALGAGTVWLMAAGWVNAIVQQMLSERQANENLVFTADGTPLIQATNYTTNTTIVQTIEGQPVENLDQLEIVHGGNWLFTPRLRYLRELRRGRVDWRERLTSYLEPGGAPNFWYLMRDDRQPFHAYFEGFDAKTRTKIGYIGTQGFRVDQPPLDEQFTFDPDTLSLWGATAGQWGNSGEQPYNHGWSTGQPTMLFMVCMGKLYRVDMKRRSVTTVPQDDAVLSVGNVYQPSRVAGQKELISKLRIAARLADRIVIFDEAAEIQKTLPIPEAARDQMLSVFLTAGDEAIVVAMADLDHESSEIYWLSATGEVAKSHPVRMTNWLQTVYLQPIWQVAATAPTVLALAWATYQNSQTQVEYGRFDDFASAFASTLRGAWPWLVGVVALSLVLAVVCFRRQTRLAQPYPLIWVGLVFVGGPAAFVGYLLHRNWPATTRCAKCGSVVPCDRFECAACAAEFPLPAMRGVEIYA